MSVAMSMGSGTDREPSAPPSQAEVFSFAEFFPQGLETGMAFPPEYAGAPNFNDIPSSKITGTHPEAGQYKDMVFPTQPEKLPPGTIPLDFQGAAKATEHETACVGLRYEMVGTFPTDLPPFKELTSVMSPDDFKMKIKKLNSVFKDTNEAILEEIDTRMGYDSCMMCFICMTCAWGSIFCIPCLIYNNCNCCWTQVDQKGLMEKLQSKCREIGTDEVSFEVKIVERKRCKFVKGTRRAGNTSGSPDTCHWESWKSLQLQIRIK